MTFYAWWHPVGLMHTLWHLRNMSVEGMWIIWGIQVFRENICKHSTNDFFLEGYILHLLHCISKAANTVFLSEQRVLWYLLMLVRFARMNIHANWFMLVGMLMLFLLVFFINLKLCKVANFTDSVMYTNKIVWTAFVGLFRNTSDFVCVCV